MPALKGRFQDANRNLGAQALQLLASLAKAMGRPIAREARPVLGPAVKCICDSKNVVGTDSAFRCGVVALPGLLDRSEVAQSVDCCETKDSTCSPDTMLVAGLQP
jgi:hypothetical protein